MNSSDVNIFEKLVGQVQGLYEEMSILSKKSPNDAVNKFKLKFINRQLSESNALLAERYMPFDDFEIFPRMTFLRTVTLCLSSLSICNAWRSFEEITQSSEMDIGTGTWRAEKPTNSTSMAIR